MGDRAMTKQEREKQILSVQNLVYKIAHKYARSKQQFAELAQEGMLGVCIASDKFDPDRGIKFTTYAAWWIRARILDYVLQNFSIVKIGTTQAQRKLFYRLRKLQHKLGNDAQVLADATETTVEDIQEMQNILSSPVISGDVSYTEGGNSLFESMAGNDDPGQSAEDRIMAHWLDSTKQAFRVKRLNKAIDLAVWDTRVATQDPMSLKDLGELLGVSRQRIDQVAQDLKQRFVKFARLHG